MIAVKSPPNAFSFYLNMDESVTFLLKLIFFRDVDTTYQTIQRSEDILATRGKEYIRKVCYPRSIGIYITLTETGQSVGGCRIKVHGILYFFSYFRTTM